jgi:hypothetical protein
MWEAFLIQMDDFDRLLEFHLRRKLDPVVAAPVPVRRRKVGSRRPIKRDRTEAHNNAMSRPIEMWPETLVFVEDS